MFPTTSTSINIPKTVTKHWDHETWSITGCPLNLNNDIQRTKVWIPPPSLHETLRFRICKSSEAVTWRNFAKFTVKHLCQSLFINKVGSWGLSCFPVFSESHLFSQGKLKEWTQFARTFLWRSSYAEESNISPIGNIMNSTHSLRLCLWIKNLA